MATTRTGNGRRYVNKRAESLADKQRKAGVKVTHYKAKSSSTPGRNTLNRNQVRTADGALSQGYNTETKQFEKTTTSTSKGLMAVEGQNNTKGATTWAQTPKNDDGSPVLNSKGQARQSGRSRLANRQERTYDVRAGLNNITPKALQAMIDAGEVRVVEGGGLQGADGTLITQKRNGNYSMGLSNG